MDLLPSELIQHIGLQLPLADLRVLLLTCKYILETLGDEIFWLGMIRRDYHTASIYNHISYRELYKHLYYNNFVSSIGDPDELLDRDVEYTSIHKEMGELEDEKESILSKLESLEVDARTIERKYYREHQVKLDAAEDLSAYLKPINLYYEVRLNFTLTVDNIPKVIVLNSSNYLIPNSSVLYNLFITRGLLVGLLEPDGEKPRYYIYFNIPDCDMSYRILPLKLLKRLKEENITYQQFTKMYKFPYKILSNGKVVNR